MKHEWRKHEKSLYLPKNAPTFIDVPALNFLTISGAGNPNTPAFAEHIQALYAVSYAIKMTLKKTASITQKTDYTVYPLEGIWDLNDAAKARQSETLNKDDLTFKLMIRQPDFVPADFVQNCITQTQERKKLPLLDLLKFEEICDGPSVQMLHLGSFDDEKASFERMEQFARAQNLRRSSKTHREIYLSDFRKVSPDKLKTVLRFQVQQS